MLINIAIIVCCLPSSFLVTFTPCEQLIMGYVHIASFKNADQYCYNCVRLCLTFEAKISVLQTWLEQNAVASMHSLLVPFFQIIPLSPPFPIAIIISNRDSFVIMHTFKHTL